MLDRLKNVLEKIPFEVRAAAGMVALGLVCSGIMKIGMELTHQQERLHDVPAGIMIIALISAAIAISFEH